MKARWASGALAVGIVLAGAAVARGEGGSTSGAIPERLVSSCPGARDAMGYGPDLLTHVEAWWRVESIDDPFEVDADVRRTEHLAMTLRPVGPSGEGKAERRTIAVHSTFLDGLRWGLGSEDVDEAYLSIQSEELDEPMTSSVLLVTVDGTARFVGDCADRLLNHPLGDVLGDQLDRQVAGIPRLAPEEVAGIIRSPEDPSVTTTSTPTTEVAVIGPPDLMTEEQRAAIGLPFAKLVLRVPEDWDSETLICTRVGIGWGGCVDLAAEAVSVPTLDTYLQDGAVELWLVDRDANLAAPLQQLGVARPLGAVAPDGSTALLVSLGGTLPAGAEAITGAEVRVEDQRPWTEVVGDRALAGSWGVVVSGGEVVPEGDG